MEEKTNGKTFPRTLSVEGQIKNQMKCCEKKKHSSNFKDEMSSAFKIQKIKNNYLEFIFDILWIYSDSHVRKKFPEHSWVLLVSYQLS